MRTNGIPFTLEDDDGVLHAVPNVERVEVLVRIPREDGGSVTITFVDVADLQVKLRPGLRTLEPVTQRLLAEVIPSWVMPPHDEVTIHG